MRTTRLDSIILSALHLYKHHLNESVKWIKPELYGPTHTVLFRRLLAYSINLSIILVITSLALSAYNIHVASLVAASAILVIITGHLAPVLWRLVLGKGIDSEIPALLAFLLPYSSSPRYLSDVLVRVPRAYFRWIRVESDRLKLFLDTGLDPVQALRELAKTTPSGLLRRILTDYVHSLVTGAPRSHVTLLLLGHAVEAVRGQWRSYTEISRVMVEALTGILIASVALAPMALFSGNIDSRLFILPLALSPLAGILLLMARPRIGDHRPPPLVTLLAMAAVMASSIAYYARGALPAILLLATAGVVVEALWRIWQRQEEQAIARLREAADDAKYGRPFDATLEDARRLAPRLLGALVDASRLAGRIGVGDSLLHVYRVVEEARNMRGSLRIQGWILTALAAIAPAVSVYLLSYMAGFSSSEILAGNPEALLEAARLLAALSPLAPLPAAVAARGWIPSLMPSLASLALSHHVLMISG